MSTVYADVLVNLLPQSAILGWDGNEWGSVSECSTHSAFINAADWAPDISFFTNFDVTEFHQKPAVQNATSPNVHTACFLFTDGDNIQWLLTAFPSSTNWWGSPLRGKTNIGWTISPALAELAPTAMKYL
jgi:hypothetical protein